MMMERMEVLQLNIRIENEEYKGLNEGKPFPTVMLHSIPSRPILCLNSFIVVRFASDLYFFMPFVLHL